MSDLMQDLADVDHPTEDEREMIQRSADKIKTAGIVMTRIAYLVEDLSRWLAHERVSFNYGRLYLDASVAVSIAINGESRVMAYLRKTQAVDLAWLRDTIRQLGITPFKIETERNVADLWTKAVSEAVLRTLLPLLGRA